VIHVNEYIRKKVKESFEFDNDVNIKLVCEKMHRKEAYVNYKYVTNCIILLNDKPFTLEFTEYDGKTTIVIKNGNDELMGVIKNE